MADLTTSSDVDSIMQAASYAAILTLLGVEEGATADQTGTEIKAAYEAESDTNAYTDSEKSKLAAIESGATADQTGTEIKAAYEAEADTNAFTDAAVSKLAGIEAAAEVNTIDSDTAGEPTGSDQVLNVVSLTQAEFDAGTPVSTTLYIITDA